MEAPPDGPLEWLRLAQEYDVESTSIHDLREFESGSKVKADQYLALHVLWVSYYANTFDPEEWGLDRTMAKKHLNGNENWKSYLDAIQKGLRGNPSLGTFDMLWEYQRIIEGLDQDGPESAKFWISSRTRSQTKRLQPPETPTKNRGQQGANPPSTPSRVPKNQDPTPLSLTEGMDELVLEDQIVESSPESVLEETPMSILALGDSGDYYELPPVDDEQIVNTALILFLQSVCLRYTEMKNSEWTLQRKSFDFTEKKDEVSGGQKKGKKKCGQEDPPKRLFQARTDGHLRINLDEKSRSLAILEVKSKERRKTNPFMQESAQMASWIQTEPDVRSGPDSTVYRRLMISQNHHEIYLTIATYDWKYVEYICNGVNPPGEPSFLVMNRFGPFLPSLKGNMERLASTVVAFTQQLEGQAVKGQPCRW